MKTVTVTFPHDANSYARKSTSSGKVYAYLTEDNPTIGQAAVVMVGNELKFVTIVDIAEGARSVATKHLITLIDLATHRAREASARQRKEILAQLEALEKEQNTKNRFESLAAVNPVAAALLAQLELA